jgi:sialidase-1
MTVRRLATLGIGIAAFIAPPTKSHGAPLAPTVLWQRATGEYAVFRIPALIAARDGQTLLAFAEGRVGSAADHGQIRLVMRRSVDAGHIWSPMSVVLERGAHTVGNIAPVLDRETGRIWLFYCIDNREVWLTSTTDDGQTWEISRELTAVLVRDEMVAIATGPGHGIQLQHGARRGRLLVIAYGHGPAATGETAGSHSFAIFSDDHGLTWQRGKGTRPTGSGPGGGESMAAEWDDGRLYLTVRNNLATGHRGRAMSSDGGETWTPIDLEPDLPEPVCQSSVIASGEHRLSYFGPSAVARTRMDKSARRDVARWESADAGVHWTKREILYAGPGGYTDATRLADGSLAVLMEAGTNHYDDTLTFLTMAP